ncbi:unnamed protein product [Leptidea sinapis]|uniref:Uncharacterized protein n=1 Tax=Leptidea sinapis TaxID=189913 RepID=A0A5E4PXJ2_9NEOP|nr:unnamed protein product [Leptidea sinapis]
MSCQNIGRLKSNKQNIPGGKCFLSIYVIITAESPEQVKKEDNMYMEMKETLDDATLLSEYVDELADDEEYMRLEDQSGNTIELPRAEKRALSVGLAMHSRGRAAIKKHDYSLALVLLLEADRQLSECRSQILSSVDNWAVLQLDIAWCYLCLRSLQKRACTVHAAILTAGYCGLPSEQTTGSTCSAREGRERVEQLTRRQ